MEGELIVWDGWLEGKKSGRDGWLEGELNGWDGWLEGEESGRYGWLEGELSGWDRWLEDGWDDGEGIINGHWSGGCIVLWYGSKSCGLSGGALRPSCCCGLCRVLSMFVLPLGPRWVVSFSRTRPRSASPSAASSSAGAWGAC